MKADKQKQQALQAWQQPACNKNNRSSGNGLLCALYVKIEQAARNNWQDNSALILPADAGLFLQSCKLNDIHLSDSDLSLRICIFTQDHLQEDWSEYDHMSHQQRQDLTLKLINTAAESIFGNDTEVNAASQLLFYLCPQLPVFPASKTLRSAADFKEDYLNQKQSFTLALPDLELTAPEINYGEPHEQLIIEEMLAANNWWQRYLFIH